MLPNMSFRPLSQPRDILCSVVTLKRLSQSLITPMARDLLVLETEEHSNTKIRKAIFDARSIADDGTRWLEARPDQVLHASQGGFDAQANHRLARNQP